MASDIEIEKWKTYKKDKKCEGLSLHFFDSYDMIMNSDIEQRREGHEC